MRNGFIVPKATARAKKIPNASRFANRRALYPFASPSNRNHRLPPNIALAAPQSVFEPEHQVAGLELKPRERGRTDQRLVPARHTLYPDEITWLEVGDAGGVERDHACLCSPNVLK